MYLAGPIYSSRLNKIIWLEVHFQSQFNAPLPEFPITSKIFSQIHTPGVFLGTQETIHTSMPQGTLLYPVYHMPSAESTAPICHGTLSTSMFMEHKGGDIVRPWQANFITRNILDGIGN